MRQGSLWDGPESPDYLRSIDETLKELRIVNGQPAEMTAAEQADK